MNITTDSHISDTVGLKESPGLLNIATNILSLSSLTYLNIAQALPPTSSFFLPTIGRKTMRLNCNTLDASLSKPAFMTRISTEKYFCLINFELFFFISNQLRIITLISSSKGNDMNAEPQISGNINILSYTYTFE